MGQPLSMNLHRRLIAAVNNGMICRAAAACYGIAPSTAIRWHAQRRDVGHFKPKAQGGDMRWHHRKPDNVPGDHTGGRPIALLSVNPERTSRWRLKHQLPMASIA